MQLDWLDYVLVSVIGIHILVAPYTKVEESFNIQAIHDMLFYGSHLAYYDHNEFPGVVPRTFVGALAISIIIKPAQVFITFDSKFDYQIIVRGLLGAINGFFLIKLRHSIEEWALAVEEGEEEEKNIERRKEGLKQQTKYSSLLSFLFSIFTLSQFHLMFYSSRTLPNMFALPLVLYAFALTLKQHYFTALCLIGFSAIVFRIELVILWLGLAINVFFFTNKISVLKIIQAGFLGVGFGTVLSCIVDSYFWQKYLMIPEVYGFFFNAVQGKSSEWGEEPWWSYFVIHIPNMLSNPVLIGILPLGLLFAGPYTSAGSDKSKPLYILFGTSIFFIGVYSFHAHKEWRFVIYIIPVLSLLAANAVAALLTSKWSSKLIRLVVFILICSSVLVGLVGETVKSLVSSYNYPGGVALAHFHEYIRHEYGNTPILPLSSRPLTVHLDVLTCMTGASEFGQLYDNTNLANSDMADRKRDEENNDNSNNNITNGNYIIYDKTEDPTRLLELWPTFDYIIVGIDITHTESKLLCVKGHHWELVKAVNGLAGFDISPIVDVVTKIKQGAILELGKQILSDLTQQGFNDLISQTVSTLVRLEPQVFIYKKVMIQQHSLESNLHCEWIDEFNTIN